MPHLVIVVTAAVAAATLSGALLYLVYGKPEIFPVAGIIGVIAAGMVASKGPRPG
jgi:hypothetical protein